jgi:hypothetical protein
MPGIMCWGASYCWPPVSLDSKMKQPAIQPAYVISILPTDLGSGFGFEFLSTMMTADSRLFIESAPV